MATNKVCKSCSGPLDDYKPDEIIREGFCPYCVDKKGDLKNYGDVLAGMLDYIQHDHPEIKKEEQLSIAQNWLRDGEVWKDRFVSEDIVIDSFRSGGLKEIGKHTHGKKAYSHSCEECMYYQKCEADVIAKENWLLNMQEKYGDCGNLLYVKGELIGYVQYAPKFEFPKLENLSSESTKSDAWYISCIYINPKIERDLKIEYVKLLLKYVLKSLKNRGVKKIQTCAPLKEGRISATPFDWKFYEELGFKTISKTSSWGIGEIEIK